MNMTLKQVEQFFISKVKAKADYLIESVLHDPCGFENAKNDLDEALDNLSKCRAVKHLLTKK